MAGFSALRESPGALVRTPTLVILILILFFFQLPPVALQSTRPLLVSVVSLGISVVFLLGFPFVLARMIGMAAEALGGQSSLAAFVSYAMADYIHLLVAYVVVLVINNTRNQRVLTNTAGQS